MAYSGNSVELVALLILFPDGLVFFEDFGLVLDFFFNWGIFDLTTGTELKNAKVIIITFGMKL